MKGKKAGINVECGIDGGSAKVLNGVVDLQYLATDIGDAICEILAKHDPVENMLKNKSLMMANIRYLKEQEPKK